jgi:hypothetical protein
MPCNCSLASRRRGSGKISFDIGMLGQYGLDINNPKETRVLRALLWL